MILKSISCFLLLLLENIAFGQNPNSKVSIELSIPHIGEIPRLNTYSNKNNVYVIIRNNSDSSQHFYEHRYIYGYFNISFEIKTKDSIYCITRSPKIFWRNIPSYHIVQPNESLVFPYMVIDTGYANVLRHYEGISENGWIGFPKTSDTVEIRAIYQLCNQGAFNYEENIGRLNYRKDDYIDYLDGDIESEQKIEPAKKQRNQNNPLLLKKYQNPNRSLFSMNLWFQNGRK